MRVWEDVSAFHEKFGLPQMVLPTPLESLPGNLGEERLRHLREELEELTEAVGTGDAAKQADALVDLVYVAVGTARMMGLPFPAIWRVVHVANMQKVPVATAKRVGKPAGWVGPDAAIAKIISDRRTA